MAVALMEYAYSAIISGVKASAMTAGQMQHRESAAWRLQRTAIRTFRHDRNHLAADVLFDTITQGHEFTSAPRTVNDQEHGVSFSQGRRVIVSADVLPWASSNGKGSGKGIESIAPGSQPVARAHAPKLAIRALRFRCATWLWA